MFIKFSTQYLAQFRLFFAICSDSIIMVRGSDGRQEFIEHCRLTCTKKCKGECKNFDRRMNLYRNHIDKHYGQLINDYQFFGEYKNEDDHTIFENYICEKKYDLVFMEKKYELYIMNTKETKSKKMIKVSETGLLSLVAFKLKGRDLFPKQTEDAKKILMDVKFPNL